LPVLFTRPGSIGSLPPPPWQENKNLLA